MRHLGWLTIFVLGCGEPLSAGSTSHSRAHQAVEAVEPVEPVDRAEALAAHAAFRSWVSTWANESPARRLAIESSGVSLAAQRKAGLRWLMLTDPELAISLAVNPVERAALPAAVAESIEEWKDGMGSVHVVAGISPDGVARPIETSVSFDDAPLERWQAGVYGARAQHATREHVRLHGVALDGVMAVLDSRLRKLFANEVSRTGLAIERPRACPVSNLDAEPALVFDGGDTLFGFCRASHATEFERTLSDEENALADFGKLAWATGSKRILMIRLDFSDLPGDPVSESSITSTINSTVNTFYQNASYKQTSMQVTVTPTLRLPKTQAVYKADTSGTQLLADGRAAAKAAGYDYATYDFDIVGFAATYSGWAGQAYIGGRGCWLNGYFDLRVIGHELGHNYGAYHANFWNASGLTVIGPGATVEYGNPFDMMSSVGGANSHFNAWFKRLFNWIPSEEVVVVSTSGTYRMAALEQPISSGYHAIKVPRDAAKDYWLEYRTAFTSNSYLLNGASVNWGYRYAVQSNLLDMTPGDADKNNSPLLIGRTFSDVNAGIHLTPVGKAGTTPEALDVVVNLGTFAGNRAPVVSLSASTTTPATGQMVTFNATASDPDGDTLAYGWSFDDGSFGPNASTATKSFSSARAYNVLLTVSDMKGQTATASLLVTVGTPTTFTLSGHVRENGQALAGVRVSDGTRGTYTDASGAYVLTNVPSGSPTLTAGKVDYSVTASFAQPLTVSASQTGLDFTATKNAGYQLSGKIAFSGSGVAGVTITDGTRVATTSASGDYALSPVPSGLYTLTASKPGWSFNPSFTNPVDVNGGNVTNLNFNPIGAFVSGNIPSAGVSTAPQITDGVRTVTATLGGGSGGGGGGSNWVWAMSGIPNGSWNFVATSPGVTLVPDFSNPVAFVAGKGPSPLNFHLAAAAGVNVSGTVKTGGTPLPGVSVTDGTRTSVTDDLGRFVLVGVPSGTYTLTPSLTGYSFVPTTRSVTVAASAVSGQDFATTVVNLPPTVVTAASATPAPVTSGQSTVLNVLGSDDSGESTLTYTWAVSVGSLVTFSANGTNAAKHTTATFSAAGTYTFDCTITDPGGLSVHSSTVVSVQSVPVVAEVTPATATLLTSGTQLLQLTVRDQFGNKTYPALPAWAVSGPGTVAPATGWSTTYTAPATPGTAVVSATVGSLNASATLTINSIATPVIATPASANPNPITGTTSAVSVRATDDQPEPALTYTWSSNGPMPVVFAPNGSNAAKDAVATFTLAGAYDLRVTVQDAQGNSASSVVKVTVQPTPTALGVQPAVVSLQVLQTQLFTGIVTDQFGEVVAPQPSVTWAVSAAATVDSAGLLTAGATAGGPYVLTATAAFVTGPSLVGTASFTIDEAPDTQAPTVSLSTPSANAVVKGSTELTAVATDNVAVTHVEFWLDGSTRIGDSTTVPYSATVDFSAVSDGPHTLVAKAFDAAGNVASSDGVAITVGNAPVDTSPPSVSVVSPTNGSTTALHVLVTAQAADDQAVASVALEVDGQVVSTLTQPPYAFALDLTEGTHSVVAIATDTAAKFTRSESVTFSAVAPRPDAGVEPDAGTPMAPGPLESVLGGCTATGAPTASWFLAVVMLWRRRRVIG